MCQWPLNTDVNAAALAEHCWGATRDKDTFLYLTVGTGIGGNGMVHGHRLHGVLHPEMGHVLVPRIPGDTFSGICPYHGDCLEGMTSGPAIAARWKQPATSLDPDHPAWEVQAHYLVFAIVGYILTLAPERVILGEGRDEAVAAFSHDPTNSAGAPCGLLPRALHNALDQYLHRAARAW